MSIRFLILQGFTLLRSSGSCCRRKNDCVPDIPFCVALTSRGAVLIPHLPENHDGNSLTKKAVRVNDVGCMPEMARVTCDGGTVRT